jgi:hypothetical protein
MDLTTTLCQLQCIWHSHHIMDGSIGNFARICSTTNAFGRRGSRCLRYPKGCLGLWGCFGVQGFGVGSNTISRGCGCKYSIFGSKTRSFVSSLGGSSSLLRIKDYTTHLLGFGENHTPCANIWRMTTKIIAKTYALQEDNQRTLCPLAYLELFRTMVSYIGTKPHIQFFCKVWNKSLKFNFLGLCSSSMLLYNTCSLQCQLHQTQHVASSSMCKLLSVRTPNATWLLISVQTF